MKIVNVKYDLYNNHDGTALHFSKLQDLVNELKRRGLPETLATFRVLYTQKCKDGNYACGKNNYQSWETMAIGREVEK